jgi:phosphonopyruvate decarboxylase
MINAREFATCLFQAGCTFFSGVPDSVLAGLLEAIDEAAPAVGNIVAANEGSATGIAIGYHLATGRLPTVYMQNSGLPNALNPLASLASSEVASIPMLCLIGWRGDPGAPDEPQHRLLGTMTPDLISLGRIRREIMADSLTDIRCQIDRLASTAMQEKAPVALLVPRGRLLPASGIGAVAPQDLMRREDAIATITSQLPADSVVVATTGAASRELFELRQRRNESHQTDFLCVGAMGHANQIALGVTLGRPGLVCVIDGDGALLMHLGGMATIAAQKPRSLIHILLNNGVHDSVGGSPTTAPHLNLVAVARALGYATACRVSTRDDLRVALVGGQATEGPHFIDIRVAGGARQNLGRPTLSPAQNARQFGAFLLANTRQTA